MELLQELDEKLKSLNSALASFRRRGEEFASARRDYQTALAKEILIHRDNGIPVTIIGDLCRGKPDIADLRLKKDVTESLYKSSEHAINCYKLEIRVLEGQIKQEWNNY